MPSKPKIYIDSACFIDMAKQKVGKQIGIDREREVLFLKMMLEAAKAGDMEAYTSTLTVAECTHADGEINDDIKQLFTSILTSGQYIRLVQPDLFIAEDARDLRWKHDITLSGADGIHVASALRMGCQEFMTTDNRPKKESAKPKIKALGLRVITPSETQLLPGEYRQEDMLEQSGDEQEA
ncbi:PIN domain-containing protein [Nitrospinae bacterium AH_259_B05_G02_I21]|nr:PIN domain-containing protein [Nitrospinae bacterium AH_259_B05_G02_I21]